MSKPRLKIIPLGGLSEIGKNMMVMEYGDDIIIIDAQYTKEEYQSKRGWGHSHYENVLDIVMAANVKKCILFHHDPSHSDHDIDNIVSHCRKIIEERGKKMECLGAQESLEIRL